MTTPNETGTEFQNQNQPLEPPVPAEAPRPPREPKVRRVGTLTMGVALIAVGICCILALFVPNFDIITVAKVAPAVLILFGLEILVSNLLFHNQKLKYDFLSGFLCFLLILGSACAVTIPTIYHDWGPERYRLQEQLRQELGDQCYTLLQDMDQIQSLRTEVYLNGPLDDRSKEDILRENYAAVNTQLTGEYADEKAFAQACKAILDRASTALPQEVRWDFYGRGTTDENGKALTYQLSIHNRFEHRLDVEGLAKMVNRDPSELEAAREELEEERTRLYDELEQERTRLYGEVEQNRQEVQEERERLQEELEQERQELYEQLEDERAAMNA